MLKIEIPATVYVLIAIYYKLGIWSNETSYRERCRRFFYFVFALAFVISIALGAYATSDPDECIFLVVVSVTVSVHVYRFWLVLRRKNEFLSLLEQIGKHYTDERSEVDRISKVLSVFMKFSRYFLFPMFTTVFVTILFPFFNDKRLVLNIQFPVDRTNSYIGFFMASVFHAGGSFWAAVCIGFTTITWYLMLSLTLEYKLLGRQLERMGTISIGEYQLKLLIGEQQMFFQKDLVKAIQTYNKINGILDGFGTLFGTLFCLQVATGSVCICGSVHTLAFSSHEDLIMDAVNCVLLAYSLFDIFMIMYFGNEILLASDELSLCLYNSNWIEQTQSCKRCVIILGERLKQPQELVVAYIYPLNLITFSSIINSAYSMFNILQNLRE